MPFWRSCDVEKLLRFSQLSLRDGKLFSSTRGTTKVPKYVLLEMGLLILRASTLASAGASKVVKLFHERAGVTDAMSCNYQTHHYWFQQHYQKLAPSA